MAPVKKMFEKRIGIYSVGECHSYGVCFFMEVVFLLFCHRNWGYWLNEKFVGDWKCS